jgi:hypothetical protein
MNFSAYEILKNESTARDFLIKKYPVSEAKTLAYRNVHAFTSYIKQGMALFHTAERSDYWSQSLLLYYGMMSLLKALALCFDPSYPQNTAVLQHGLTSPKRKKEPYRFFHDEIRVQKDGFFPYLSQLFHHPVAAGERFKLGSLCSFLPDLQEISVLLKQKTYYWEISYTNEKITFPTSLLDQLCIPIEAFVNRLNKKNHVCLFTLDSLTEQYITLKFSGDIMQHPWFRKCKRGKLYLWINTTHSLVDPLPEILTYYGLFFSLSMLSRYDPPVWRELCNDTEKEQLMIQQLITTAQHAFPSLIFHLLWK